MTRLIANHPIIAVLFLLPISGALSFGVTWLAPLLWFAGVIGVLVLRANRPKPQQPQALAGAEENDSEGNGWSCAKDSIRLPSQIKGAKHVKGVVVLDTKYKRGTLALVQDFDDTGWEWNFPASS